MIKNLFPYLRPYKKQLIIGSSFKFLEAVLELFLPILMAQIIDVGIKNNDKDYIFRMGLYMLLIIFTGLGSAIICQYSASIASQGFGTKVRQAFFSRVNHLSFGDLDKLGTDTLITRITNDVNQLQVAVAMLIRLIFRAPFVSIGCIIAAMILDLPLSLVIWIGVLSFSGVLAVIMLAAFPLYTDVQKRLDNVSGVVRENFAGVRVIRAFARVSTEMERFVLAVDAHAKSVIKVTRLSSLMNPLTALIMNLVICSILWFGALRVNSGDMTTGKIIAFISYMAQILTALIAVANLVVIFTKASASGRRVSQVLVMTPSMPEKTLTTSTEAEDQVDLAVVNQDDLKGQPENRATVVFDHVCFSYVDNESGDEEKDALHNISFRLEKGQVLGIIGGTGSGKTTIISLLAGFYYPQKGTIEVDGKSTKDYSLPDLRSRLGIVFQEAKLFSGTVEDNIRWGNSQATQQGVYQAADRSQSSHFISRLDNQYDTWIDRDGKNLSGGQKQRLSIARAFLRNPEILLLDDASSALDFATEAKLRQEIAKLQATAGTTVIMVSQRIASIREAGQILVLEDGRQAGLGTHQELMASCQAYRSIAVSQMAEQAVG